MAYDQGTQYQPPRRPYQGQHRQQVPIGKQFPSESQRQYDGYDQGYDQGYGQQSQQYGGYDDYGQNMDGQYTQGYNDGGGQIGYGYEQQYDPGYDQQAANAYGQDYANRQPQSNGRGRGRTDQGYDQQGQNGYHQQERHYDPRYQQRPGRGGLPALNNHRGDPGMQRPPQGQDYRNQAPPQNIRNGPASNQRGYPVQAPQTQTHNARTDYSIQDEYQVQNPPLHKQVPPNGYAEQQGYPPQQTQDPRNGHVAQQGYQASQRQDAKNEYSEQQIYPHQQRVNTRGAPTQQSQSRSRPPQSAPTASQSRHGPQSNTQPSKPAQPQQTPLATRQDPKKMSMEQWKAQEKAKMHEANARPETVAQDTAFPTFPAKKKESRTGGQSAMSSRSSEDQARPSTASSRPTVGRDNSYQTVSPPREENGSQMHRPSVDHQPYSFESRQERTPPQQHQREPERPPFRHQQSEVGSVVSSRHQDQHRAMHGQQQIGGIDDTNYQPQHRETGQQPFQGQPQSQSRARGPPQVQPIETHHAQMRRPTVMDHQPLSPANIPPRPSTAQARSPLAQQQHEQLFSPTSQYSQFDSPDTQYNDQPMIAPEISLQPPSSKHNHQRSSLGDVYDGYYGNEPAMPVHAPQSRAEEIESEMPDFDSAAPSQTSNLHKRNQTVDRHLNEAPKETPPPMPAMPRQHTNQSVQSLPTMQYRANGGLEQPMHNGESQNGGIADGFVFGTPGEELSHQQYDQRGGLQAQQHQDYPPRQQSVTQDGYDRRPVGNGQQMRMPMHGGRPPGPPMAGGHHPGPPQSQRFHPGGKGLPPPQNRPQFDRQPTSQTIWSDPGQVRGPSAPPLRQGLPTPPSSRTAPIGAPLTQQRSAPDQPHQRHSNPDALPQHPTPVRPGLTEQGQALPQAPLHHPAPVRNYDARSVSSNQSHQRKASLDISNRPVTQQELALLRSAVDAHPENNKTSLLYAKKLVEASSTLASEGGRLDVKTTQRNREKYIMDAHKRIKKLVSTGYPDAQFYLADCYGQGLLGLEVDTKEAFNLYQAAAKAGHGAAAYRTAVCCEMGPDEGGGTRRDYAKAVQWYRRAAALGDTAAMFKLGMILLKGLLGTARNVGEASSWLKRAADCADKDNPHALHELGLLYETGNTNPEVRNKIIADDSYALSLFRQAADLGFRLSQFRLGQAHEYGTLGLPIDNRASISWYSKAAAQGEHQAELALSGWYLTGAEGILEHNETEAYLWARKAAAAEPPLAKALFAMGYFSEQGIGCPRSVDEARRWYGRAASYKFPKALERLEELKKNGGKGPNGGKPPPVNGKLTRKDQKRDEENCVVM